MRRWMYEKEHIFRVVPHILICKSAFAGENFLEYRRTTNMSDFTLPILTLPPRPAPRDDLDDLIYPEDGWLVSDR